ncbi:C3 and PZP-like alpha-2-macroglobulin domain-containing protein 8 [Anthonomus grandis grandis]|uniref:C3 and PZP-like alpha-2-macroglobulin domain-containing protein 8 n=1 Tax=Anthonomus grandis grandis TaxID=2921223 RepID=UPI002165BB48|nr:C3 and PZP-like alpha-2-macroglobulin domain-containing protein 8 [Anthonomus grandis grandis]XP_050305511.1 C3 and PZP-like alpha-2-macroglobulin domain-containing protein 8 [Anthonomus grandis grandis]
MQNYSFLLTILLFSGWRTQVLADECITGFSVVTSELVVPGKTTAVFITLNNPSVPKQPLNVTLRLLSNGPPLNSNDNGNPVLIETTQEIIGHGILPLNVPSEATGTCILQTLINCTTLPDANSSIEEEGQCELKSSSEMRIVGSVREVIVRPSKHAYRPEETLKFWLLALDHDLQIASDTIGVVSVKDPQGTKVAIWDQVSLDTGVLSYSLPLSPYALTGRWSVVVEVDQLEYISTFEVTANAGLGPPDISVAEEHYVELKFGNEMRRRYKPGLPFSGKVEAMSTEKSVRVRVKVYDNTTSIYSQDIEISNGEGTFIVPAILADSDIIYLQAELVSVESKEIESHYVLAREPIRKWNSSSDCYLLIEGVEHTLQPEEEAYVTILSTCPCERDVHYVITTDGRISDWAQRRYEETVPVVKQTMQSIEPGPTCKLNFSFMVQAVMAPVSQLLVYYVTPQGEPISDVISFDVKLFNKEVVLNMENREYWLPDQLLDIEVVAEPSSLVCLLGGRSESTGDLRFDPRISEEPTISPITEEVDFLEAGVSYFQRECSRRGDSGNTGMSAISYRQRGTGAGPSGQKRRPPESLVGGSPYNQLWMWNCYNYSRSSPSTQLSIMTPKEPGKWSIWGLLISNNGLKFSAPITLEVFRPLTVDFHLPPSLKVREVLEVDIKIENNVNLCVDVTALLALSEGAQFVSNGLLYVTERLRLGPHGATSLVVRILALEPGTKNLTVEVNGYASPTCEGLENINNTTLSGAVIHSASLEVFVEGSEMIHTESSYFCANEHLVVSTTDNYKYEWIKAPHTHESMVIEVKSSKSKKMGPVHIALADSKTKIDKMYRITIGDADNSVTHIGRGKHNYGIQLISVDTPEILSEGAWKIFWITWNRNTICFGNGSIPGNGTLLKWKTDKKIKIEEIGFASSWGALAEFRIWNFNEESGFSQVLHLDTPKHAVPGSERGELTISGGLELPRINKINGGGLRAALASLTPLLSIKHDVIKDGNDSDKLDIIKMLPGKIQSILSFKKEDDSFSEHPMLGSHKATVSILEALSKVQLYFNVDPDLIQAIKRWVQLRQEDDGRFVPLDADVKLTTFNSTYSSLSVNRNQSSDIAEMENIVEITAETVIALYEIGIETDADSETLQKAKIFLENSLPNVESPETIAAVTLALVLVRSATAAWAIEKLRNASTTEDGEFGWPHFMPKRDAADWLYETGNDKSFKVPILSTVEEYRASLYALSTFCLIGDLKTAQSVARFLFYRSHMLDNHYELLYPAVKSFREYNAIANDKHRSMTISLATSGMELTETLNLNKDRPLQTLYLPSLPTKVFVYATGAGCATIQGRTLFSTYASKEQTALLDIHAKILEEILPDKSSIDEIEGKLPNVKIQTCFKWKGDRPSPVLRLETTLFSGYELSPDPPQLLNPPQEMAEMQHGNHGNNVWFVFANISTPCPVCVQYTARSLFILSGLRPAYAKIYPVARDDLAADIFFHAHESRSSLLNSVTSDDMVTWFGIDGPNMAPLEVPEECEEKYYTNGVTSTTIPSSVKINTKLHLVTYTINVDNSKQQSVGTVENTTPLFPTQAEQVNFTIKSFVKGKSKKVLLRPEKITKINKKVTPSFQKNSTTAKPHIVSSSKRVKPISTTETYTHQTIESTTTRPLQKSNSPHIVKSTSIHVNTEQIHNIPNKLIKLKVENEEINKSNPEYVLLNKDSLWEMLKEAVNDDTKRKELTNMLREKEK